MTKDTNDDGETKASLIDFFSRLIGAKPQDIKKVSKAVADDPYPYNNMRLAHILGVFFDHRKKLLEHETNVNNLENYIEDRKNLENKPTEPISKKPQGKPGG